MLAAAAGDLVAATKHLHQIGATDKNSWTALMHAAKRGHLEVVKLLLAEAA